ncbi:glycosyltransferase family 2 protein [Janthinobacterium sp. 64]|uniref:glycosyltransferase family 2 protein n=1 Tax=Janthinobacterium sp. 64 TaxID=2035208 RepID=UPI000CBE37C6|nr:glycosyltransferase family 2 protein [Janthinobacterium sp. 64]PKB22444.1 rhamnosyltransferase [Janthinobacterium sp. 64]
MSINITTTMAVGVIVPTLNAGHEWSEWLKNMFAQTLKPARILIIDSSSDDSTAELSRMAGCEVIVISREDFNHGTTRKMGASLLSNMDILVYMTQDAFLSNTNALEELIMPFYDPEVSATYGRQLPHHNAGYIGAHARIFNYPDRSTLRSISNARELGIKVAFISNSFSAYRRIMLNMVGGFPDDNIFGEDTYVAAKLLIANKKIGYVANAQVYHSHDYSYREDFRRCFDIGVFHSRESWILKAFGRAEGEGRKFVFSELKFLLRNAPWLIPDSIIRNFFKYVGYKLGSCEKRLSRSLKKRLSMHRRYWGK